MSPRCLIINADDFGFTPGITEGIVKEFQKGVLTSTSAMNNMPNAPERIASARSQEPRLPVGLHLNITSGKPVLPPGSVPTLVDSEGRFYPIVQLIERLPLMALSELNAEICAQATLLKESSGPFDHIDYHQMVLSLYQPGSKLRVCLQRIGSSPASSTVLTSRISSLFLKRCLKVSAS